MKYLFLSCLILAVAAFSLSGADQPETPVASWTGKTILLIGAHPDDDIYSQGTLAMLQDHGNEVWVTVLTTGNVGTQDPDLSRYDLSQIRRKEELAALAELGIPEDHYINLGYDDGLLEFQDQQEVVAKLVRVIRQVKPDILFAFDPGKRYVRWRKSDHRMAAVAASDAARAAMWRLLFEGQVIHEGLEAHTIPEYMFYDSVEEDKNLWVDIGDYAEKKIRAMTNYISQFGPGWEKYTGEELTSEEEKAVRERVSGWIEKKDGKSVEGFRYYRGLPDGIGK